MDSGNSGSLPSSSGGGDGGDGVGVAGGDVNPSTHFNSLPILQSSSNFFDPSSFSQNLSPNPTPGQNSMYNLDSLWSNTNSDSIYSVESHHSRPSRPSHHSNHSDHSQHDQYYVDLNPVDDDVNPDSGQEKLGAAVKNPKKRARASRRAPTTVLTTDTTNFRQMVQEFTGIPAVPFTAASSSSSGFSRRIDLFGGGVAPVNPLRYMNSGTAALGKFHLPPSETQGLTKQPLNLSNLANLSNLQNQMFPFQSISQTTLPQQGNVMERENQRSEPANVFGSTSSKRWRVGDENMVKFEGVNRSSQNVVVSNRSDGEQIPGNEDSWICPSD